MRLPNEQRAPRSQNTDFFSKEPIILRKVRHDIDSWNDYHNDASITCNLPSVLLIGTQKHHKEKTSVTISSVIVSTFYLHH